METRNETADAGDSVREKYLENVKKRLAANFELAENCTEGGERYDLIARYFQAIGRIFITPQDIIDRMETFEQVYVKCFEEADEKAVLTFFEGVCRLASKLEPGKDHFQTDITGVMVCSRTSGDVGRLVKKLRYDKLFRMYFRGWCEVRFVCVDLSDGRVFTNPAGKELKKVYTVKQK